MTTDGRIPARQIEATGYGGAGTNVLHDDALWKPAGGGGHWTQTVGLSGASFSALTAITGTWASDGVVIRQSDTADLVRRARINTLSTTGVCVFEADIRIVTLNGTVTAIAGLLLGWDGSTTGAPLGRMEHRPSDGSNVVSIESDEVAGRISAAVSGSNLNTWRKLRVVAGGNTVSVYLDGVLYGSAGNLPADNSAMYLGLMTRGCAAEFRNIKAWAPSTSGIPGDPVASGITFTPVGNVAATDVQAAVAELDAEKAPVATTVTLSTVQLITGQKTITPATASTVGLIVKGAAAQSQNLVEWKNSADALLGAIGPQGAIGIGGLSPGAVAGGQGSNLAVGGYTNLNGFRLNGADASFPVYLDAAGTFRFGSASGDIVLSPATTDALVAKTSPADGQTAISVRRNIGDVYSLQVVSMGAVDSAGVGFRTLRVPN